MRCRLGGIAVLAVVVATGATSCGSSSPSQLTVFAAASLTNVLPRISPHERYSFGGSNALATQVRQGAPADVFASADTALPEALYRAGLVDRPVVFAHNALTLIVPRSNPGHVHGFSDLLQRHVKLVVAARGVPAGDYTRVVLRRLHETRVLRDVVSEEPDVRDVLAKVALGEADAGFVYRTDARSVAGEVEALPLPAKAQPDVLYAAAAVRGSPREQEAKAWVERLRSGRAQRLLRGAGFLPLPRR